MNNPTRLSRIARRLTERSGSDERIDELTAHIDQLEADGQPLSPLDVGSIAILVVRSPLRVAARAFAKAYASIILAGIAAWWIAAWTGLLDSLETTMERALSLEEFQFIGIGLLLALVVIALPLSMVFAAPKLLVALSRR